MKMFRKDEGFTLVELMVVVLIIGILVAIAIPVFLNASANAQLKACQGTQRTIEGAVQTYNAQNPASAYSNAGMLVDGDNVLINSPTAQAIKSVPKCPAADTGAQSQWYRTTNGIVDCDLATSASQTATMTHVHF